MKSMKQKNRLWSSCFLVLFSILWNVVAWYASIHIIHAGQFNQISGPGGHVIDVVKGKTDPVDFWVTVMIFPISGAALLVFFVRKLKQDIRRGGNAN
jgi:hypothetical protein